MGNSIFTFERNVSSIQFLNMLITDTFKALETKGIESGTGRECIMRSLARSRYLVGDCPVINTEALNTHTHIPMDCPDFLFSQDNPELHYN
jgi:hypothetical protein